jgi:hypothetical protein
MAEICGTAIPITAAPRWPEQAMSETLVACPPSLVLALVQSGHRTLQRQRSPITLADRTTPPMVWILINRRYVIHQADHFLGDIAAEDTQKHGRLARWLMES